MEWKRPEGIPYPNTWNKFDGLREINGKKPKFWIQDITEDLLGAIVEMMTVGFIMEEPLCKFSKFAEDQVSVAEGRELYKYILRNQLSCVCMTKDSNGKPTVVGVSTLARIAKDDPHLQYVGETLGRLRSLTDYAYSVKDIFTTLGVEEFLSDRGIYVLPQYRGQGMCGEFLKCWPIICKAVGLKVVAGTFTSIVSQKVADRAGFSELNSFPYVELGKVDPRFRLPGIEEHTKNLRILYLTV